MSTLPTLTTQNGPGTERMYFVLIACC